MLALICPALRDCCTDAITLLKREIQISVMRLVDSLIRILQDGSLKGHGEFSRWLDDALEKMPEFEPLDVLVDQSGTPGMTAC